MHVFKIFLIRKQILPIESLRTVIQFLFPEILGFCHKRNYVLRSFIAPSSGAVIGAAIGGAVFGSILTAILFVYFRRRSKSPYNSKK